MKKKMENFKSHFKITDNKDVIACGIPALDGDNHGRDLGNDIAAFWGKGKTFILVNMRTGSSWLKIKTSIMIVSIDITITIIVVLTVNV